MILENKTCKNDRKLGKLSTDTLRKMTKTTEKSLQLDRFYGNGGTFWGCRGGLAGHMFKKILEGVQLSNFHKIF